MALLATFCAGAVLVSAALRASALSGFARQVNIGVAAFAGLAVVLNVIAPFLLSPILQGTMVYAGVATLLVLFVARHLEDLTYDEPRRREGRKSAV